MEDIAVVRTLPDDCEYHDFFWNHAERIAEEHGVALHDIVLCTCFLSQHSPSLCATN